MYPEWEKLIEDRRVILSEEFTLNREAKRKAGKTCQENDVDVEVIEPQVETIDLEVDSEEELFNSTEKCKTESTRMIGDNNKGLVTDSDENKIQLQNELNSVSTVKSESDEDILELDGLSDVETMHIPLENLGQNKCSENFCENPTEETSSETNVSEMLPKITNIMGNIIESTEYIDEQKTKVVIEKNNRSDINNMETEQKIVNNRSSETKDMNKLRCDSDDSIDDTLRERAHNLMNIEITQIKSEFDQENKMDTKESNTNTFENLQEEKIDSVNETPRSVKELPLCDSEDEIDKLVEKKANVYISTKTLQTKIEEIEQGFQENSNVSKNEDDVYESIHSIGEIDDKDKSVTEEQTVKKEKHEDCFEDAEFDDDQIEFVDDGIEFVEDIDKKKTHVKIDPTSESEDESLTKNDDYPKIDLKLLLNPTVYTKKLDVMNIFQFADFEFVNDKKIIESAIFESKPINKRALKDEDINKLEEQAIRDNELDSTPSDSDIVQTTTEDSNNRVKCTSWLLQKPKNRKYNPIQLCKNPDFNTRLKRLTAGFLSSTRNREFLKECKPLTIDLHKAFEQKLINGTMYLKSGDFKSAKYTTSDVTLTETLSVLPSILPGQSMMIKTTSANNISIVVTNKSNNLEDSLPAPPHVIDKHMSNERRKIINLPDIDQVRRVNQSLLTAEVTPIRIDNKIDSNNPSKETVKTLFVESAFVQPITYAPLVQIKNESLDLNFDDKNKRQLQLDNTQLEVSSGKDLMVNKIHDQIINLSNQISEVDNNELLSIDVEKSIQTLPRIKNKVGKKPKKGEKKSKLPQKINKLTYTPKYTDTLTWSPKYPKNHIADSLLALDTLSRMLFLLNGNEDEIKNCSCKQKRGWKEIHNEQQYHSQNKQNTNEHGRSEVQTLTKCHNTSKSASVNKKNQLRTRGAPRKRNQKPRGPSEPKKYSGIYCCWAREKIIRLTEQKNTDVGKHTCHVYQCICCCRQELVSLTTWKSSVLPFSTKTKKLSSTIVLSDDEGKDKNNQNNKEVFTNPDAQSTYKEIRQTNNLENNSDISNAVNKQSDKVTIEIVIPSLTPHTKANINTDSINPVVNSIAVQTDTSREVLVNIRKTQTLIDKQKDILNKQKSCKTIVHAADGHVYNKRIESITTNDNEKKLPIPDNSGNAESNINKENTNRILFLNSSQIVSKPTRTPIYLGKNKILLCSLKTPSVTATPINPYLPVLPCGVNFVMLPNGELTLSIDNGTQLDSEQLSALPALMAIVQEQFLKSTISNKIPEHSSIQQENDHVKILGESNVAKQVITNSPESLDNQIEIQNKSRQNDNSGTSDKEVICASKNMVAELSSSNLNDAVVGLTSNNENVATPQTSTQSEIVNTESESQKLGEEQEETKNQITEPELGAADQINTSQSTKSLLQSEPRLNDNNDRNGNINVNPRKTILSDLMEMSGISADDTNMMSDATNPLPPFTTLPPNIIPVTRSGGSGINMLNIPTNTNVPDNISIAGPYSNLHSFEPTTPINNLLNYIAQVRPELNAVTSFVELKYVHENNGRFYKLDVDSGVIAEIKVFIKKNPKSQIPTTPKAFIDLTEDTCDNENVTCAEFQDIPQDKQVNVEVKPIKLFKAVHPAILRRTGRSLLRENEVVYPKKLIHISRQRRKQLLNIGNKYVLVDIEKKNELNKPEDSPPKHLDSSYDSSDEEPLAKKSRRKQAAEENVEETIPLFVDAPAPNDSVTEHVIDISNITNTITECGDTSDLEMSSMDIEGVNPELHPVAFEEGSESDDDMCILGV